MKKLILVAAMSACFSTPLVNAANPGENCGTYSAEVQQELDAQAQVTDDLRKNAVKVVEPFADMIEAPAVDISSLSCIEKYRKFKVVSSMGWPTINSLFQSLENMVCQQVDQKVAEMTSKLTLTKKLPFGLGSVGIGIKPGAASGDAAAGMYNSGSPIAVEKTQIQNQNMSGRVTGGLKNIFR